MHSMRHSTASCLIILHSCLLSCVMFTKASGKIHHSITGSHNTLRFKVHHVYSSHSPLYPKHCTLDDSDEAALCVMNHRLQRLLHDHRKWTPAGVVANNKYAEHYVNLLVGDQDAFLMLDTSSSLTWAQCFPCDPCFNQTLQILNPTPFTRLTIQDQFCLDLQTAIIGAGADAFICKYSIKYLDQTNSSGYIVSTSFSLTDDDSGTGGMATIPNVAFGCGTANYMGLTMTPASGILALGAPVINVSISFAEQFTHLLNGTIKFSYCLPSLDSYGSLLFGPGSVPTIHDGLTTLFQGAIQGQWYIDIIVNGKYLMLGDVIGFNDLTHTKGTMIDCGTFISRLIPEAYDSFRIAWMEAVQPYLPELGDALPPFDTCYDYPNDLQYPPFVIFLLRGGGIFQVRPHANMFIFKARNNRRRMCWSYLRLYSNLHNGAILMGSHTQVSTLFSYDSQTQRLSWVHDAC